MTKALRILCRMDFPTATMRLWDGSGPYLDPDGEIWRCCVLQEGALDQIEHAINGEAFTLQLGISGIDPEAENIAWKETHDGDVIGSTVQVLIQEIDEQDAPIGEPSVEFTGTIDDIEFGAQADDGSITTGITVMIVNRFTLRVMANGGVLSDVDQRARSARLNPEAPPDRIAERIPILLDQTIQWPVWN